MDHNKNEDFEEFSLEDILNEFRDEPKEKEASAPPQPEPESTAPVEESAGLPSTGETPHIAVNLEDTGPMAPISSAQDLFQEEEEAPAFDLSFSDRDPLNEEPAESLELDTDALLNSLLEESPESEDAEAPELDDREAPAAQDEGAPVEAAAPSEDKEDTHRYSPQSEVQAPPPPIPFSTPHSRLWELKKKLVSGPEKRYYELSEAGIGKLQAAIFVNILVVLLCAGAATLYALDAIPEARMRLVIFSQVLAMLVSALMGCQLMLDAFIGLFKGKFTVNTLLTVTFFVCLADSWYCLKELRVPCCAAFCLSMTMALWARYEKHSTEMAQMDTMRKAVRLHGLVRGENFYQNKPGLLHTEGEVEDFMDTYQQPSGPEKLQNIYALLSLLICVGIAAFAGLSRGVSMTIQILSTSLLVAVPASFFISITRPTAILEQRLHMVGTVLCGWQGVRGLRGKSVFPLTDTDLFPQGCTKLNGVKFYGSRNPDEVVSYTTSLICQAGGGLVPVFQQLLTSRDGVLQTVESFRDYGGGGIGGVVCGEPVLMGDMAFLQDMGVEIPEGTMVSQAVYAAIDGKLCAVYAISYARMRSASAGLVALSSCRRVTPVMVGSDFMITEEFIQTKFGIKTKRLVFPDPDTRRSLCHVRPDPDAAVLALATREELIGTAYAVTGSQALSTATHLGVAIHLVGGILGMLIMLVLAILGNTELLIPSNVLLYQLIWAVPGILVTEWVRAV